jgi:hypothetical protein
MNSFLTRESSVDAQAPIQAEERADAVPLLMPICTLLKALCNAWKECQDKLRDAATKIQGVGW